MIRVRGIFENHALRLQDPVALPEGTEVIVDIHTVEDFDNALSDLGMSRLEEEWDNPEDSIYDNWKSLYGV